MTGATDGLGRAVANRLSDLGWTVHVHGRDTAKLAEVVEELGDADSGVRSFQADLAELAQVHRLAAEVSDTLDRLDVLVDNAGIGFGDGRREVSADGYELRFAVNHLAGFCLILELLPLLRASAPARVVRVASLGQQPVDFDDVMLERDYDGFRAYRQAKLAQVTTGFELADRLDPAEVTVNSLHPGTFMPTKMVRQAGQPPVDTLETGIESTVRLVTDPALDGVTGRFFDRTHERRALDQAYDPAARAALWRLSLDLTGAPDVGAD